MSCSPPAPHLTRKANDKRATLDLYNKIARINGFKGGVPTKDPPKKTGKGYEKKNSQKYVT